MDFFITGRYSLLTLDNSSAYRPDPSKTVAFSEKEATPNCGGLTDVSFWPFEKAVSQNIL